MYKLLLILPMASLFFLSCTIFTKTSYPDLPTVSFVDLKKYIGKWYEIASLPVPQQKGCSCTTAEYEIIDEETIRVINRCRKGDGWDEARGKAFIVPGANNSKLRVQFFWPFRGDYWIIDLADDYSYAVVGMPSRKYFWILSRTPKMNEQLLQSLLEKIKLLGFDVSKVQRTFHDCEK